MNNWRQKILPTVLAGALTVSFGSAASAKGYNNGNGNDHKPGGKGSFQQWKTAPRYFGFTDLQKHWAEQTVKRMVDKAIIKGYPDHTFRPNKPVTQLEALTMVINLLSQNRDLLTSNDRYDWKDVPDWAQTTVKLAMVNHIVDSREFQPNKPATRLFVVKLLVNALGGEIGAVDEDNLYFGDIASLSSAEREYLSYALLQSLVAGYEDKTFKPNKPVTRAEMAVFVNRLLGKIGQVDNDKDVSFKIEKLSDGEDGDEFAEAVKTGSRVSDSTPDLSGLTLYVSVNGEAAVSVELDEIDGTQDDGGEVADELENAIASALDEDRVEVSYDDDHKRFVFETVNSPTDEVPSLKFTGSALNELGIDTLVAKGSKDGSAAAESWKIAVTSDASSDGTYTVSVKDDHIDETVKISVDEDDSAEDIADKLADALADNDEIGSAYDIDVDDEAVILTAKDSGEDVDLKISIRKS
ncbi:S-layer homology domain-containing protein [Brevibacillus sp. GCM10020057]|uniref:S-layer homology domain-containing protein n=1 Tax=Brevibacillus sp. GCM10020057 TaxID=3317327 RepID=UPI003630D26D